MNRRWVFRGGSGVVALVLIVVLAFYFQDYLTTRVIGPTGGRISVRQGQKVNVKISTAKAPSVKVELCQENLQPPKCQVLASQATGTEAKVTIPASFPLGKALLQIVERDRAGKITSTVQYRRPVVIVKGLATAVTPKDNSSQSGGSGGGAGSGGGGSDSGGSGSVTTPSPITLTALRVCIDPTPFSIYVEWSPVNSIVAYRPLGQSRWHHPLASTYDDIDGRRSVFLPTDDSYNWSPGYRTEPNIDMEIQFDPDASYTGQPKPNSSETYRFNTGPAPVPDDFSKAPCAFRELIQR